MQRTSRTSPSIALSRIVLSIFKVSDPRIAQQRCAAEDISYLIFFIGYQYYFAFLKLYALFTLHVTAWGTREGVAGGVKQDSKAEVSEQAKGDQRAEVCPNLLRQLVAADACKNLLSKITIYLRVSSCNPLLLVLVENCAAGFELCFGSGVRYCLSSLIEQNYKEFWETFS